MSDEGTVKPEAPAIGPRTHNGCHVLGCSRKAVSYFDVTFGPLGDFINYCDIPSHKDVAALEYERITAEQLAYRAKRKAEQEAAQPENKLAKLSADYATLLAERDALRERCEEFETACADRNGRLHRQILAMIELTKRAESAEAQLATARRDAIEDCAKACEQELQVCCGYTVGGNAPDSPPECCGVPDFVPMAAKECAERIRALSAPLSDKTGVV